MQTVPAPIRTPKPHRIRRGGAHRWLVIVLLMPSLRGAGAAATEAPATFQPDDISIGAPIALPFARPASPQATVPADPAAGAAPSGPAGWLGMSVAESTVPGRWAVVEVIPEGPAAAAGIAPGDELRGVNGRVFTSSDDVSQALTAITAGQRVQLSVARSDQVRDVEALAVPRPGIVADAREWRSSNAPMPPASPEPPSGAATVSVLTNPPAPPALPPAVPTQPSVAMPTPPAITAPPAAPRSFAASTPSGPVSAAATSAAKGRTALGVRTVPIDRGMQERFRLADAAGAYVVGVVGDLPASKAGIPPGSVIVALADRPVRSPQELTQLVTAGPTNRPIPVQYVLPGGEAKRADVVLQSLELPLEQALLSEPSLQQAAAPPALTPGPAARTARRPAEASPTSDEGEIRQEIGRLRSLLDSLERRLQRIGR